MQEDKESIFDAHDTVSASVRILAELVAHTHFNQSRLRESAQKGFMEATALAEYLVARGVFFRDAHHIVGKIIRLAEASGKTLAELDLAAMQQIESKIDQDVYGVLACEKILDQVASTGGTGRTEIQKNLTYWKSKLADAGHES